MKNLYEGTGKHWDSRPEGVVRLNENMWFELYQPMLLWILNEHPEGRNFFCFTGDQKLDDLPYVSKITKNYARCDRYEMVDGELKRHSTSVFCVGAKFGNIVRYKWDEFQTLVADYNKVLEKGKVKVIENVWQR